MKFYARILILVLGIVCLNEVLAGKPCEKNKAEINERIKEKMKNGELPKCFEKYKLTDFLEDDDQTRFQQFLESKKPEEIIDILTCGIDVLEKVFQEVKVDEDCKKMLEDDKKKLESLKIGK